MEQWEIIKKYAARFAGSSDLPGDEQQRVTLIVEVLEGLPPTQSKHLKSSIFAFHVVTR